MAGTTQVPNGIGNCFCLCVDGVFIYRIVRYAHGVFGNRNAYLGVVYKPRALNVKRIVVKAPSVKRKPRTHAKRCNKHHTQRSDNHTNRRYTFSLMRSFRCNFRRGFRFFSSVFFLNGSCSGYCFGRCFLCGCFFFLCRHVLPFANTTFTSTILTWRLNWCRWCDWRFLRRWCCFAHSFN